MAPGLNNVRRSAGSCFIVWINPVAIPGRAAPTAPALTVYHAAEVDGADIHADGEVVDPDNDAQVDSSTVDFKLV